MAEEKAQKAQRVRTIGDVKLLIAELKTEIRYFGNRETNWAFDRVISEWGFNPEDYKQDV